MMRSLWTAASGMMAQQTSVDTISNNLANVNTVGYKSESTEFKSLLYQNLQAKTTSANGENKPVSAQVGLGSRVVSVTSHYTQGAMNASESSTDFAINGDGFFAVQNENGDTVYTRNGNFYFSTATEGMMLCTADGYPVLSTDGQPIVLTDDYNASKVKVDKEGNIQYPGDDGNLENIGIKIGLFQFTNPSGLEKLGGTYLAETDASGIPLNEETDDVGKKSELRQNYLEASNVEVATEMVTKVEFSVPGENLDYFLINGPTMKEVLMRYTDITGKPSLPAPWTFGLWLSTSFTTNYDEKTVNSFVDGMFDRKIPLSVFHFDCFWMKDFNWCDFTWDSRVFPDPEGMLKRLKAKGLKICVWINSYVGQESSMFKEGVEGGYFLKRPNGDVWQWDMWQPGLAIVDFTNPAACEWYSKKLEALLDMGVDCFKTDFGERIPTDAVYYDGSDPVKMHNYYTYLYNKVVFNVLKKKKGEKEAVLFARSATAGGQKFPVHWGGDCWSDYESMEESLRGGLSLTSSGFGYWSHDIGGFESTSTPDVYKRWCAFGLLSSHSRLHGSTSYRVPWAYDEEAVDVVRYFAQLKASLMPYLYRNAIETSKTGIPMMRSMVLEFTEDKNCAYLATQYMLGDSLLAAPIFRDDSIAEYYLPEGTWTSLLTGEVKEGGKWYTEKHGYLSIPLYVKEGSIVAMGARNDNAVYDYADGVTFRAYALKDGIKAETVVYGTENEKEASANVVKNGSSYQIAVESNKASKVALMNVGAPKQVNGASYTQDGENVIVEFHGDGKAEVVF